MTVSGPDGAEPTLNIRVGGTSRVATYVGGSGTDTLTFSHQVSAEDAGTTGIEAIDNGIVLGEVEIKDGVDQHAVLTFEFHTWISTSAPPIRALFKGLPTHHDEDDFTFEIKFSEAPNSLSYRTFLGDGQNLSVLSVTNGTVDGVRRLERGSNQRWEITIDPDGSEDVSITLPQNKDCKATGAICKQARPLRGPVTASIPGSAPQIEEQQAADNNVATGAPAIAGTAQVGETLTTSTSGISDEDGTDNAVFAHQWIAYDGTTDTDIQGANASTYTLTDADQGRTIQVRVSFTDDAGNDESLTSAATAAVEARPNSPATGAPAITGTAQVGETLTVDTSSISDSDGTDNATFSYQWLADDADIAGATSSAYTLADADEGKAIRVQVSFTDDRGNDETLTSEATEAVEPSDQQEQTPEPTDRPHGLRASADSGTVVLNWNALEDDSEVTMYRILRHRPEEGESAPLVYVEYTHSRDTTYTDTAVEPGTLYVYSVQAADFFGFVGEASDPVSIRVPASNIPVTNSPATGAPVISGTAQVGETLTVDTTGISDSDGTDNATFSFQWLADDSDIAGATGSSYTLTDTDEDKAIKVRVSFTDDAGNDESLASAATDAVAARPNSPATGAPTISGTAQVGETLTAGTSGIVDDDGLDDATFSYQWLADDTDIAGATGSSYILTDSGEGKAIRVRVSFTDDGGSDESLTSAATGVVEAAPTTNNPATGAPTISGTVQVGETLTAGTSGISDTDGMENATFTFQWQAGDADISSATGSSYTLLDTDEGKAVKVQVSFTDDAGNDESVTSAATAAVEAAPPQNNTATGAPTISGTVKVGHVLTADATGIDDQDGIDSAQFTYQWLADDTAITGATDATYLLTASEKEKTITVTVSFTDDEGNEEALTSLGTVGLRRTR